MRLSTVILALLAVCAATASAAPRPRVVLLDTSPVRVTGTGFGARSAVHVTVSAGTLQLAKTVRDTAAGTFAARFDRSLPQPTCTAVTIRAASGVRVAVVKIVPDATMCGTQRATSDP